MTLPAELADSAAIRISARHDGARVTAVVPAGGSSFHHAARLRVEGGPDHFLKWGGAHVAYAGEAQGLGLIESAGASGAPLDPTSLREPPGLLMRWIEPGPRAADFEERLGRRLARLHSRTHDAFGFDVTTHLGPTPLDNTWCATWLEFFVVQRFEPLLCAVCSRSTTFARLSEALPSRLEGMLGGTKSTPRLIHGDLWSGNVLTGPEGQPVLIDPAASYADRELELGMTSLFGGFSQRFDDAYAEVLPLRDGAQERIGLYRLYHLVHHVHLFGASYLSSAERLARRYV